MRTFAPRSHRPTPSVSMPSRRTWYPHSPDTVRRRSLLALLMSAGKPSHPELLEWLATEFVERKWSIKSMHRLIMTSDAYRRSSNPLDLARDKDPANTLLSHFNRRRLQAEEIRDAVLQVSGNLNL